MPRSVSSLRSQYMAMVFQALVPILPLVACSAQAQAELKQLRSAVAPSFFKKSSLPVVTSSIHALLRLMECTGESK